MRQSPPLRVVFAQQPNLVAILPLIYGSDQLDVLEALDNVPDSFRFLVLKKLIEHRENNDLDVEGALVEAYAQYMIKPPTPQVKTDVTYTLPEDKCLVLSETRALLSVAGGTGHRTWEAAKALIDFLITHQNFLDDSNVVELGAGCGLVGMSIASIKPQRGTTYITDGDPLIIPQIEEHVERNNLSGVEVDQLVWGTPTQLKPEHVKPGLVVAADVLYDPACHEDLLDTVEMLNPDTVLISSTVRNKESYDSFKKLCLSRGMRLQSMEIYEPEDASSEYVYLAPGPPIEILQIELGGEERRLETGLA